MNEELIVYSLDTILFVELPPYMLCTKSVPSPREEFFSAAANALGIGAASFCSEAEKDIAESPMASPERPK